MVVILPVSGRQESWVVDVNNNAAINSVFADIGLCPFQSLSRRSLRASVFMPALPDFAQALHIAIEDRE